MSRYGLSYYGLATYGGGAPVSYIASGFNAQAISYGTIKLKWNSPSGDWSKIRLVRNSYGFAINPTDGTVLRLSDNGSQYPYAFKETDPTTYTDTGLATNRFYYYSLFVYETTNYQWIRVGDAIGLSVKDYKYLDRIYEALPAIYKVSNLSEPSSGQDNPNLRAFLSLFAFHLSMYHTLTNLNVNRYDTTLVSGLMLPAMLKQFGLDYEPEIGYQQSRILVRDAVSIFSEKGSRAGLTEFMKAFTGYSVPSPVAGVPNPTVEGVTVGHNLMLDYNDSSFEESVGHWAAFNGSTVEVDCLKEAKVTAVSLTSNVATLTIGSHNYQVGQSIYVSGSSLPLFNQTITPVSITARTSTSISFSLSGSDLPTTRAYNGYTKAYPVVKPYPLPREETTAPALFPNKQKGTLAIKNTAASAATLTVACGADDPVNYGIPVNAGTTYTFSCYTSAGKTTRSVTASVRWYTRFGVYISTTTGTAQTNVLNTWEKRVTASGAAPTSAYYAVPVLAVAAAQAAAQNEYHFFDCAQFEAASSATDFDEARQIHLTLRATRINELKNPHFAGPIAPWVTTGATYTVDTGSREYDADIYTPTYVSVTSNVARVETSITHDFQPAQTCYITGLGAPYDGLHTISGVGATSDTTYIEFSVTNGTISRTPATSGAVLYRTGNALKLYASDSTVTVNSWDGTTTAQLMPIHYPTSQYIFSTYAKGDGDLEEVELSVTWYNSSNAVISTNTSSRINVTANGVNWNRLSFAADAPATAAYASVKIKWYVTYGNTLWLDSAMFEAASELFEYFDGDGGLTALDTDFIWEGGTPNAGRSHYYKNRFSVQTRLGESAFTKYLQAGSTVAVYLGQPKT